jgi:hypothetical protein
MSNTALLEADRVEATTSFSEAPLAGFIFEKNSSLNSHAMQKALRAQTYLTNAEVDCLIQTAGANRNGYRDATMVLVAYRHGLRPVDW